MTRIGHLSIELQHSIEQIAMIGRVRLGALPCLRNGLLRRADWIEHVIATDGDQYLKTPEHLLLWHVRAMLDVYLALALIFGSLFWLAAAGLRRLFGFGRRQKPAPMGALVSKPLGPQGVKTYHVVASTQQGTSPCLHRLLDLKAPAGWEPVSAC